jgi:hypothetical protein
MTSFAKRVTMPSAEIDIEALVLSYYGIKKQIRKERYPDRKKKLNAIRMEIESLLPRA